MSGRVTEDNFHTTKLKPLAEKTLATLKKRFHVSEDIEAATRIANFKQWPLFFMKEDVTGRMSLSIYKSFKLIDEDVGLFFLTAFGEKELKVPCQQFAGVLQYAGVASEQMQTEWVMPKAHLYNKWV